MTRPIVNLQDTEHAAQAALGEAAWAYFSGGAGDEITLRHNQSAWQKLRLSPRVLQDLRGGHTRCRLLGREWPMPLLVAPMAYQRWAHAEGESGMALAAAAQGCGMVLSHQTSTPLHDVAALVAKEADRGPLWFQLYWLADRGALRELLVQVEAAGFGALVLTVDAPVHGVRDRERRHGVPLPEGVKAVHWPISDPTKKPRTGLCVGLADAAPTWADVLWLIGQTRLPVLLKGITHPQDAVQAVKLGAAGVIVSNHGGRVLDTPARDGRVAAAHCASRSPTPPASAGAGRWRHSARHRLVQSTGLGGRCSPDRPPRPVWLGPCGCTRRGACAAPDAR